MVAATPEHGVATRQLTADAMARTDLLRVQPVADRYHPWVEPVSHHRDANLGQTVASGKSAKRFDAAHSPMIFITTLFGRLPSHSP
jgi:hypothetical protein